MAGPIHAGEEYAGSVVVLRRAQSRRFNSADMLLIDSLSAFCGDIVRNLRLVHELRQLSIDMIRGLVSAIDQKDGYTSGHSNRVAVYARILAEALGWPDERLQMLEWSALLHDVGKIGIRDAVLKKSGKLTHEEFEHMKEHPVRSYEVVKKIPQLAEAIDGVLHHHERYDGRGYPSGLAGEAIPLQARVIQIADIFDALTSSRSYRRAFTWEKALDILKEESGIVVDPKLSALFDGLIREWSVRDPEGFRSMFDNGQAPPVEPEAGEGTT
jgi:HD-GYP domain-containing protein (c-di-GMP phosphodiesterase class II)